MSPTRIRHVFKLKCTLVTLEGRVVERDLVAVVAAAVAVQLRTKFGACTWGLIETAFGIDLGRGEREGVPSFVQASRFSLGENCEHASDLESEWNFFSYDDPKPYQSTKVRWRRKGHWQSI